MISETSTWSRTPSARSPTHADLGQYDKVLLFIYPLRPGGEGHSRNAVRRYPALERNGVRRGPPAPGSLRPHGKALSAGAPAGESDDGLGGEARKPPSGRGALPASVKA